MCPTTSTTCSPPATRALRLGDTALILSQQLCARVAAAHSVEEDIAQANIALDLLGQARAWLTAAGKLDGSGRSEDDFAYQRDSAAFDNLVLVELENTDFARTIMRQFLFDSWHLLALRHTAGGDTPALAAIAEKAQKEVIYHLRHSGAWMERLGDGTEESHRRLSAALDDLWRWCGQFFDGVILSSDAQDDWLEMISPVFTRANLTVPPTDQFIVQRGHSEHLGIVLAEMQSLHRAHPGMQW